LRLLENNSNFRKLNKVLCRYRIRLNALSDFSIGYRKRVRENHINRINNKKENYTEIVVKKDISKYRYQRRIAEVLFWSENYTKYRQYFCENIFRLLSARYFLFYLFSLMPNFIKSTVFDIIR